MKDRIQAFLLRENKTSSQFAEEIGVQPSSVSHILSGRNKPSLDFVIKMLDTYPDISTDWLLFGRGSMSVDIQSEILHNEGSKDSQLDSLFGEDSSFKSSENDNKVPVMNTHQEENSAPEASASLSKVILLYSDGRFTEYKP